MRLLAGILGFLAILGDRALASDSLFVRLLDDAVTILFPPVRVSVHLCQLGQDDAVGLSKLLSKRGLAHEIHRELEEFEGRSHDTWEHHILYVLDLDCDYAVPLLRAGVRYSSSFIFREPLLSTVSNIFTLPFQRSVWIAIAVLLLLVVVLLYFSSKWEYRRGASASTAQYWQQFNPAEQTLSDNFMVVLGAIAQQGYSYEPYRVPPRIVTLMLLIAAMSLYASYTANIVALVQSTTDFIKTPKDLYESPLRLAAQDVVYARYYFTTFQDPIRKAIAERIEPKGRNSSWISLQEGVERVRKELFAFHGERGTIFKIMQETYQEEEKCGITEIDVLNILYPLLVLQVRSPYLEIIKNTALLLRESGLKFREEYRLYTERPQCQGQTSFISIGFTESYFAMLSMVCGTLLSLLVLTAECIWHKKVGSIDFSAIKLGSLVVPQRNQTPKSSEFTWEDAGSLKYDEEFSNEMIKDQ